MSYQAKAGLKYTKVVPKFLQNMMTGVGGGGGAAKTDAERERPNSVRVRRRRDCALFAL